MSPNIVPDALAGLRIDVVLAEMMPEFSRTQLTTWLKEGKITLDNKVRKPKEKVYGGESIQTSFTVEPVRLNIDIAENIPLDIVYEDEHLLIINKQAGLVVHPGAGNHQHTLVNALLYHSRELASLPRAGIVHRLDKDTTGLLIVAKTLICKTQLIRQLEAREINRHYIALVQGHIIAGAEIETLYGRHPRNRLKMAVREEGKLAITRYTLKKQYQDFTLLNVQLLTGRTHQIRVHLAHIRHPLVGDTLYGLRLRFPKEASDTVKEVLHDFKRQALHACSLHFVHPITKEPITVEAPLPADFQHLLNCLDNKDS